MSVDDDEFPSKDYIPASHRTRCTGLIPGTANRCRLEAAHKGRCLPLAGPQPEDVAMDERADLLHGLMQERVNETAARMSPRIQELERANDELRQEVERLRADAAYGQTAMDSYAVVQRERDQLEALLAAARGLRFETRLPDGTHILDDGVQSRVAAAAVLNALAALAASPTMTPASCPRCGSLKPVQMYVKLRPDYTDLGWCPDPFHTTMTVDPEEPSP